MGWPGCWNTFSGRPRGGAEGRRPVSDIVPRPAHDLPEVMRAVRARTPARILVGRAGPAYRTATALELRHDHAAAVDAVHAELEVARDLGAGLLEVRTRARDKAEYLMRPDLGRRLDDAAREAVRRAAFRRFGE